MNHTDKNIPYENLNILNKEFELLFQEKFKQFLDKGWFILGNEVKSFEENFAHYCGTKYALGVANGLDALILGLQVFDFPKQSEIIVPKPNAIKPTNKLNHPALFAKPTTIPITAKSQGKISIKFVLLLFGVMEFEEFEEFQ